VQAHCVAFIEDMAGAYEWADLVICRAGALTVAELAATGVASVLVPFPHAVDDHQTANANFCRWLAAPSCCRRHEMTPEIDQPAPQLPRGQLQRNGRKGARDWPDRKPPRKWRGCARSLRSETQSQEHPLRRHRRCRA
jgi:UDP-N-acetylglucosamine--N-acetylmuramyl-(pentapeptide) pyrophosphoryl-undecaprenol N-acetylglucosamine transferase